MPSRHPHVRQGEQRQHLCRVLRQAAVAHLDVAKLPLDHPERVLDLGAHTRLVMFPALCIVTLALVLDRAQLRRLFRDQEAGVHALQLVALVRAGVAAIAVDRVFLAVQQLVHLRHVGFVGRRARNVVHQP